MHKKNLALTFSILFLFSCGGGGGGGSSTPSQTLNINFSASLPEQLLNSSITLSWNSNATSCSAEWTDSTSPSGSQEVVINNVGSNTFSISCSGLGSNKSSQVTVIGFRNFDGIVVDGYIADAQVFIDENNNLIKDLNENSTTSDNFGNFSLRYNNGSIISIGGTDIDTQITLDNLFMLHKLDSFSDSKIISPMTSVKAFMNIGSNINDALGIDSSINIDQTDPVLNRGDQGIYDFLFEKGNQLMVLAYTMQNISNDLNNSTENTKDFFVAIAEELEAEFNQTGNLVNIESEIFINKVFENIIETKDLNINEDSKNNTVVALSGVLPILEVKNSDDLTASLIKFAISTFQEDIKTIASNTQTPEIETSYTSNIIEYIAQDQNINSNEITPDITATADSIMIPEDTSISIDFLANDIFISSAPLTITVDDASNGALVLESSTNNISYYPNANYFGSDSFSYTITQGDKVSSAEVSISVSPVNDMPTMELTSLVNYEQNALIIDDVLQFAATLTDVDNNDDDLIIYGKISDQIVEGTYLSQDKIAVFNVSNLNNPGYQEIDFCVSDGSLYQCLDGFGAYFIADKQEIDIEHSCDGDGINCSADKHYLYYLVGNSSDSAKTEYVFIGDRITQNNAESFRSAVLQSINTLNDSDAGPLIDGFFSVAVIEEAALTGLSAFEIETGCYTNTPTVYCINDVSRERIRDAFDYTVAAFISSLSGRGVAQGDINIQQLSSRTDEVVMHELGHSHGYMGDEYDSGSEYGEDLPRADTYINTTSVSDSGLVKWKHFFDDPFNIPGVHYNICFNYSDGEIYYRDQVGNGTYQDCECFYNQFPDNSEFDGENFDPTCMNKAGRIPGTYYSETDTFRPYYWTVMESGKEQGYNKVNLEGFAFGSIMNQGFGDFTINGIVGTEALVNDSALENDNLNITINAVFDNTKLTLKWFKDGVEQTQLQNNTSVQFIRPNNNSIVTYSWKVETTGALAGIVTAPNDIENPIDFYEGWFEQYYYYESDSAQIPYAAQQPYVGSWLWYSSQDGYLTDDQISSNQEYMFAEICCSMGAAIKIDWSKYNISPSNDAKNKPNIFMSPSTNRNEKVLSFDLTKESIVLNKIDIKQPNKRDIRRPFIKKTDRYVVNFFNQDNELIYQLGIGNPFEIKIQHIGYVDKHSHTHNHDEFILEDSSVSNLKLVIPSYINPQSISLSKRDAKNAFKEIARIPIN